MKTLKPRSSGIRPSPETALSIAAAAAPNLPPAKLESQDRPSTLNVRLRSSTVAAITDRAREKGLTIKQVVSHALADAGIAVAQADLEDRTPRRRG
jgi:hypothetical protein